MFTLISLGVYSLVSLALGNFGTDIFFAIMPFALIGGVYSDLMMLKRS